MGLLCRWFDSAAGTTSAVLTVSSQLAVKAGAELRPYTVRVFTSHLRGAGTDANICINAIGVSGSSGWKELPAKQGTFEQGQVSLDMSREGPEMAFCSVRLSVSVLLCTRSQCQEVHQDATQQLRQN